MAVSLKHNFVSPKADGIDSTLVQPSNWNEEHDLTLSAGKVLGRDTSSSGVAQELPIAVTPGGDVGIGTSTPDALLTVNGVASFGNGAEATPSISHAGNLNTGIWFPSVDVVAVSTNGTERVRVDASGNVGVGTNSPSTYGSKFAVAGDIAMTNTGYKLYPYYVSGTNHAYISSAAGGEMTFGTGTTTVAERLRIDTSGNVGIGTISPAAKLDVNGSAAALNIIEGVYAVSGTTPAIDPGNGAIQTWTLTGNSTPTSSLAAGESVTLMIDDGTAYTITWTSLVGQWIGGSAPTLATSGYSVVELWKVGSTVYAAYVGDLS